MCTDRTYDAQGKLVGARRPNHALEQETEGPQGGWPHRKGPGQVPPAPTSWPEGKR